MRFVANQIDDPQHSSPLVFTQEDIPTERPFHEFLPLARHWSRQRSSPSIPQPRLHVTWMVVFLSPPDGSAAQQSPHVFVLLWQSASHAASWSCPVLPPWPFFGVVDEELQVKDTRPIEDKTASRIVMREVVHCVIIFSPFGGLYGTR